LCIDSDGLELACLVARPLIRIEGQEAQLLELDLVQGQLRLRGRHRLRVEREKFYF
jgi:hypothetical protein